MRNYTHRLALMAAVSVGGLALFLVGFLAALAVRSALADPGGPVPNPGHAWVELQDHGVSGSDYWLGTTDNNALELWVNSARALRLEPNGISPNVIGGYSGNSVTPGVVGATISGGGGPDFINRVTDDYGTVGGGEYNQAGDNGGSTSDAIFATVSGGSDNRANYSGATVGGGVSNTASFWDATVSGGAGNHARGYVSTVGGGTTNDASGQAATIGGGSNNAASAVNATVGGGYANHVTDDYSTVGGGGNNQAGDGAGTSTDATYATVAGGVDNTASGCASTVGGGSANAAGNCYTTVSGGLNNLASGHASAISGGLLNTASNEYATVGGGRGNAAAHYLATVAGGDYNTASGEFSAVGGGLRNLAGTAAYTTVGGGAYNTANNEYTTIGGGKSNEASGGGATVAGGEENNASGLYATVGGGESNTASGVNATVPGGYLNTAQGIYSLAAGLRAKANNQGCFVWGDSTDADVGCNDDNRFIARASGGVYLYTSSDLSTGAYLAAGSGSWSDLSDRNLKDNFTPVDGQDVLATLAEMPITAWNYKTQDSSIRHMGPTAQDFSAAFGLGESETAISTVDADGVALAATQALYELSQEQAARIQGLEQENASLQRRLDDLETRVTALEEGASTSAPAATGAAAGPFWLGLTPAWLLLGGLMVVGLVVAQRRRAEGQR